MTDNLRNMPRYIRNTDAFGWQGADHSNGPWRSIAPPQNGTPWQTVIPMNELRQTRDEVSGVDALNPSQPVPVNERLPGDELCWWYEPDEDDGYGGTWTLLRIRGGTSCYTHWLPANALPTPCND